MMRVVLGGLKCCFSGGGRRNPYDILGVKSSASVDQIKKSYRILAQKYHPDKNPDPKAKDLFLETKQAYEILADEDKKRQWDNENLAKGGGRGYGFDKNPFDEFNDEVYKDKSRVHHETYSSGSARRKRGEDINQEIEISFLDAMKGARVNLKFKRKGTCTVCNGNRCQSGTAPTRCLACGGSGSTIYRKNSIVMHLECSRCHGIGLIIKHPCPNCKATGINVSEASQVVEIPPGLENGDSVTQKDKGNQSQNGPGGDLHVKVHVDKHRKFRKNGPNIESTEWLTISQAALGTNKTIQTIWGPHKITVPPGTQDGHRITLKGSGIKRIMSESDHLCLLRVKIPTQLTEAQKRIFQELGRDESPGEESQAGEEEEEERAEEEKGNKEGDSFQKIKDFFK